VDLLDLLDELVLAVQGWEWPWVREFQAAAQETPWRVKLPAAA
jgi:hypothetical protein